MKQLSLFDMDELKQEQKRREPKVNPRQKDYYDKWHPECERGGSVAKIEDIELKLEDL